MLSTVITLSSYSSSNKSWLKCVNSTSITNAMLCWWEVLRCFYGYHYRLYSCLANGSADEFQKGDHLYKARAVKDVLQIGKLFIYTAIIVLWLLPAVVWALSLIVSPPVLYSGYNCVIEGASHLCHVGEINVGVTKSVEQAACSILSLPTSSEALVKRKI